MSHIFVKVAQDTTFASETIVAELVAHLRWLRSEQFELDDLRAKFKCYNPNWHRSCKPGDILFMLAKHTQSLFHEVNYTRGLLRQAVLAEKLRENQNIRIVANKRQRR